MDQRGKPLGVALWSPRSEISLRCSTAIRRVDRSRVVAPRARARAIARGGPLA
jgi:hypothetical protein